MRSSFVVPVLILLLMLAASCKRKPMPTSGPLATAAPVASATVDAGPTVARGDLRSERFAFMVAVFSTSAKAKVDVEAVVRSLVRDKGIVFRTEIPKDPTNDLTVVVQHPSVAQYAPPTAENLRRSGRWLSDADVAKLSGANEVTTLFFGGPASEAFATNRLAVEIGAALASATDGHVFDDETRESFNVSSWRARLDGWEAATPYVGRNIVIHMYKDGELTRLVTLGMHRFALPDISVSQVSTNEAPSMGTLINLACQTLFERSTVDDAGKLALSIDAIRNAKAKAVYGEDLKEGATRELIVRIADAVAQEGDAANRQIEIVFPGAVGKLQERQTAALTTLFGSSDSIVRVKHDDPDLLAASARAKAGVRKLKPRFLHGAPQLEHLLVKAPFKTSQGSSEWMWVEVVRWDGPIIYGVLQSQPYDVPELKAGARVEVNEDAVFDYIYRGADGGVAGNETGRLIEARGKKTP